MRDRKRTVKKPFPEVLYPTSSLADYGTAALSGVLSASSIGAGVSMVANGLLGGATYLADCAINKEPANAIDFAIATAIGATAGRAGGSGANGKKLIGIAKTSFREIGKTTSKRKIAMYTAKLVGVRNTVIKSVSVTMGLGIGSSVANNYRKKLTGSSN